MSLACLWAFWATKRWLWWNAWYQEPISNTGEFDTVITRPTDSVWDVSSSLGPLDKILEIRQNSLIGRNRFLFCMIHSHCPVEKLTLRLFALQAMARDMCAHTYPLEELEDALQFLQLSLSEVTNSNLHVGSWIILRYSQQCASEIMGSWIPGGAGRIAMKWSALVARKRAHWSLNKERSPP